MAQLDVTMDYSPIKVNIITLESTIETSVLLTMDQATSWLLDFEAS